MEVESATTISQNDGRPVKRKHDDVQVSKGEALPQPQRMKGNQGWVRSESDDGTSRHTHCASGRVILEASSAKNKEGKDNNNETTQTGAAGVLQRVTPKIADMTWRFTPKIVIAAVRGEIAMAKDALATTTHAPSKTPGNKGKGPPSAGAVDAVATANMLDGLVSNMLLCHSPFILYTPTN